MRTKGLVSFLLLSILLLYLTCEVESKRGGGGSRGGSRGGWGSSGRKSGGSWFGGSSSSGRSKSKSTGGWFSGSGSKTYGTKTYKGKSYAGGYGNTWGSSASAWSTTSGLNKFGSNNRWAYSGGHRFYYVGYHPYGFGGYGYHGYGHHHYGHSQGNDMDYEWKPMSPWTVMFLVWLGLFSAGFLAWLAVHCMYKR